MRAFLLVPVNHVGTKVVLFGGFGLDEEDTFGKGYNGLAKGKVELQVQPVVAAHIQQCFTADEFAQDGLKADVCFLAEGIFRENYLTNIQMKQSQNDFSYKSKDNILIFIILYSISYTSKNSDYLNGNLVLVLYLHFPILQK